MSIFVLRFLLVTNTFFSPQEFTWTGPDPDHHFSIAVIRTGKKSIHLSLIAFWQIVPAATKNLFGAISAWSNIQHVKLTNLSFDSRFPRPNKPLLPPIPSLKTLFIGQATFLPPVSIAHMVSVEKIFNLERIRLVDAYSQSIWESRIRRSDVEKAAVMLTTGGGPNNESSIAFIVARVQALVSCERETERIMGGDRVEGSHVLL